MCGIAGVACADGSLSPDPAVVRRMCGAITHRGPDDEGIFVQDHVGLGMRRLSIIDLPGGHQPIHNEDQSVWIVFNGEIYNFRELRAELLGRGHRFYTNSDTEVIVHLYEDLGSDCVLKLRGMFAFAIYDLKARKLLLARDRLGIKPLHYACSGSQLFFGSEIKAILAAEPGLAEVDPCALAQFFQFGYVPDPATAFRQIRKLPPGYRLEWQRGEVKLSQYWDLPPFGTQAPLSEEECLRELERRLEEAVRIRLMSDVPLGAFLSGGVDSSIVVALMARASSRPVKTFTIGFGHQDFDESSYARLVAERFGTEHCELRVEPDFTSLLDRLTGQLEEPFADTSVIPTYYVSELARQHVKVALSGDGGDELFAGYDRYAAYQRRSRLDHLPAWLGQAYQRGVYPRLPRSWQQRKLASNLTLPAPERYLDGLSLLEVRGRHQSLFTPDFVAAAARGAHPLEAFRAALHHAPAGDPISRLLYLDTKTYLAGDILTKVDRMSMAVSLEARVPILDHLFVEWVTSLPLDWKLRGGARKYILRQLAGRLGVPHAALARRKRGFTPPLRHWLRSELRDEFVRILLEPRTLQRGYLQAAGVRQLLDAHLQGRFDHSDVLWQLLVFELWHRNFVEGRQPGS